MNYPLRKTSSPEENMVARALWSREVEVFLCRRLGDSHIDKMVSVTFATDLEAEQFHRLLLSKRASRV